MIYIYRIYQCLIMVPLIVVSTIITALVTIIGSLLGGGKTWGYYPEIVWSRIFCWLAFVKVKVSGRENIDRATSYVFVCNHQSAYDIFAIYGYLGHNFRWMMKASLRKIPFVGFACECSKQIYVDKSSPAALRRTMKRAEMQLRDGMSLVVFPEGARTPDGRMHRFRRGAFVLADEFHLPVVPVTIDGAYSVMPRTARLPLPGTIRITIHKPIMPPRGSQPYDMNKLMERSASDIAASLPPSAR